MWNLHIFNGDINQAVSLVPSAIAGRHEACGLWLSSMLLPTGRKETPKWLVYCKIPSINGWELGGTPMTLETSLCLWHESIQNCRISWPVICGKWYPQYILWLSCLKHHGWVNTGYVMTGCFFSPKYWIWPAVHLCRRCPHSWARPDAGFHSPWDTWAPWHSMSVLALKEWFSSARYLWWDPRERLDIVAGNGSMPWSLCSSP